MITSPIVTVFMNTKYENQIQCSMLIAPVPLCVQTNNIPHVTARLGCHNVKMLFAPTLRWQVNLSAEFVSSQKGRRMVQLNGYKYRFDRAWGPKSRWRCSTHCARGCRASIMTVENEIVNVRDCHSHEPRKRGPKTWFYE